MPISCFAFSNPDLMIENGRHSRQHIEKDKRFWFHCKNDIENELHFVTGDGGSRMGTQFYFSLNVFLGGYDFVCTHSY